MSVEVLVEKIMALMLDMEEDLKKSCTVKSAAQRSRVKSLKLTKLMKQFRQDSVKFRKNGN